MIRRGEEQFPNLVTTVQQLRTGWTSAWHCVSPSHPGPITGITNPSRHAFSLSPIFQHNKSLPIGPPVLCEWKPPMSHKIVLTPATNASLLRRESSLEEMGMNRESRF